MQKSPKTRLKTATQKSQEHVQENILEGSFAKLVGEGLTNPDLRVIPNVINHITFSFKGRVFVLRSREVQSIGAGAGVAIAIVLQGYDY